MAVTKYNESEKRSSSMFAVWDGADPVVNFQSFIDNNDDIVDVVCTSRGANVIETPLSAAEN